MHKQTRRTTHFFGTRGQTTTEAGAETPGVCEAYGEDTWRAEVGCGTRFRARPSTASCAVGCVGKKRRSLFDRTASSCQVGGAGAVGGLRIGVNPSLIKPMSPRSLVHASLCERGGGLQDAARFNCQHQYTAGSKTAIGTQSSRPHARALYSSPFPGHGLQPNASPPMSKHTCNACGNEIIYKQVMTAGLPALDINGMHWHTCRHTHHLLSHCQSIARGYPGYRRLPCHRGLMLQLPRQIDPIRLFGPSSDTTPAAPPPAPL